jgi:hypothetical protein
MSIQQMSDRISDLLEERLGVGGKGLDRKLRRGGRFLPRPVRAAAMQLAEASAMAQNPTLRARVDHVQASTAYDLCLRHLNAQGMARGWRDIALSAARGAAFAVLVSASLFVAYLVWRGYV